MAVVAVVLTAAALTSCAGRPDEPAASPTPGATVTPTATPTDLARGPAPRTGLVVDGAYTPPAGASAYPLPRLPRWAHVAAVTRFAGGLLVADDRAFEGTNGLTLVTAGGTRELGPCPSGAGAADAARTVAAWATSACPETGDPAASTVHLLAADGTVRTRTVATPASTSGLLSVAGILGGRVVVNRVFDQGAFLTDLDGPPRAVPGVVGVVAVDEAHGTVAAALSTSGSAVLDPETGDIRFRLTRDRRFGAFSPDGSTVLALASGRARCATVWFLDAETGAERGSAAGPAGACPDQVVWEDDTHVLVTIARRSRVVVLRYAVDGAVEQAGGDYPARTILVS